MQRVRFRIDLAPGCSLGPGKIDLLEAIASAIAERSSASSRPRAESSVRC